MKIPLLGEGGVGKTTLVKGFMEGKITKGYSPTMGVEVGKTTVTLEIKDKIAKVNFQLWDLAGQSAYKKFRTLYYRGAVGLILVYDIGCRDSFEACEGWLEEAWGVVGKRPMVLVGNKSDLRKIGRGEVTSEEGEAFAKQIYEKTNLPALFVEACAIRLLNADKPFKELAKTLIAQYEDH
ncbi:MAG: GTP-binding protein [Candidatus Heimdallarchaeota archaeon]